jgi:uncharacterized membrane protein
MNVNELVEALGKAVDITGIVIIVVGAAVATVAYVRRAVAGWSADAFVAYRRALGRAILLGLEFLVAGDIIRTVAISPTFESVGVLGLIVVIRTFLSVALQVETEARWPWQPRPEGAASEESS